jgi:hypothetical protein
MITLKAGVITLSKEEGDYVFKTQSTQIPASIASLNDGKYVGDEDVPDIDNIDVAEIEKLEEFGEDFPRSSGNSSPPRLYIQDERLKCLFSGEAGVLGPWTGFRKHGTWSFWSVEDWPASWPSISLPDPSVLGWATEGGERVSVLLREGTLAFVGDWREGRRRIVTLPFYGDSLRPPFPPPFGEVDASFLRYLLQGEVKVKRQEGRILLSSEEKRFFRLKNCLPGLRETPWFSLKPGISLGLEAEDISLGLDYHHLMVKTEEDEVFLLPVVW